MNQNETRTLWISIGSALFAVFLMYSYSQEKKAEYDRRYGTSKTVVVAKENIQQMETIDVSQLETIERPVDFIEPGSISDPEDIIGQVAAVPVEKGSQILKSQLYTLGPDTGIALQVSPGKRALSLPIDEIRGIAKLVKPGDRIDLIAALDIGNGRSTRREIKTIMQDIVILATGSQIINDIPRLRSKQGSDEFYQNQIGDLSFTTITVEVDPKQAQDLIYILSTSPGSLFVALRNPNDRLLKAMPASTLDSVLGKTFANQLKRPTRVPARTSPPPQPPKKKKNRKGKGPFVEL